MLHTLMHFAVALMVISLVPYRLSVSVAFGLVVVKAAHFYVTREKNPFAEDTRKRRKPYIIDQKKRDGVIKQGFAPNKVPQDLDAIIIGSGMGGLTAAVIMAKVGKRVLVLEQHDQAGGCCHTFIDKGYEFDVGIHYIGEMAPGRLNRTLVDQVTDGQLEWAQLETEYDIVSIGYGDGQKKYPLVSDELKWKTLLKKQFPGEERAIDKYLEMVNECKDFDQIQGLLKLLPLWLSWIVVKSGLIHFISNLWSGVYTKKTADVIKGLTDNKDLQSVFCYSWGDFGTSPQDSHFAMQALLCNHFMDCGGYYPVGGASEIAMNMIPIIEASGGKVLVRASVEQILCDGNKAVGVNVKKGTETHSYKAPIIISNAGAYNTFQRLLPPEVANYSYFTSLLKEMKPGMTAMSIFVGLNASNEDLGLKPQNTWAFTTNNSAIEFNDYTEQDVHGAREATAPLMFVSFPSAKDPNWTLHPGRENKSTCAIVAPVKWEWFNKWVNKPLKKRGDDYDEVKKAIADQLIEQTCQLFPQIRHNIDYIDIGTPVTNTHYLAQPHGEIYGLDHSFERLQPWTVAQLRPKTDIEGLYMTGQDACLCGFTGALFGGVLCSAAVLGRNTMGDLESLHARLTGSK